MEEFADGLPPAPFHLEARADLSQLRRALENAGLGEDSIAAVAGLDDPSQPIDCARVLRKTSAPSAFNTLLRLFVAAQPVEVEQARAALVPASLDELLELGLLVSWGGRVRSQAMLLPLGDVWALRDFDIELSGAPAASDHVLGVGVASLMLANLTVRRTGERVFDLGTGGGIQAFLAARHAARVVGSDTNARALEMAELGARLNGLTNLEFRQGSLYDPAVRPGGELETFDLIVANPPFAVSPESRFVYRDGGMPGDALCQHVVRHAGEHLAAGGFATVICDWHHTTPDDWQARPLSWAAGSGCDVWVLQFYGLDLATYASQWLHVRERGSPLEYARRLDDWLAYYARLGIGAFSRGAIILHKRAAKNWAVASRVQFHHGAGCGAQIERIFAARDLLSSRPIHQLLDVTFRLAPGAQLHHMLTAEAGNWVVREAVLRHEHGLDFEGRVDRLVAALLAGCDGSRTLGSVVASLAASLGAPLERVEASAVELVAVLLDKAFLEIAAAPAPAGT